VLKPDNKTPVPLYGVQMLQEAGLPRAVQVVCLARTSGDP
jgi:hypothetical protein